MFEGVVGVEAVGAGLDQLGPPPARIRTTAAAVTSRTASGSCPSTVAVGMPNAAARPAMVPATAPSTGMVVA